MRVNVYSEELTQRIQIISKTIDGVAFTGLRFYLELPVTLNGSRIVDNEGVPSNALNVDVVTSAPGNLHAQGPFQHGPGDDDSSAVTFWGKTDLRIALMSAIERLDEHYKNRVIGAGADSERDK